MNLIKRFASLLATGVTFHLKVSACGDQVQLDIVPVSKENKAGVLLKPQSLIGSAEEIDQNLEAFLASYLTSTGNLQTMIAESEAQLAEAQAEAKAKIGEAVKAAKNTSAKPAASKPRKVPGSNAATDIDDLEDEPNEDVPQASGASPSEIAPQVANVAGDNQSTAAGASLNSSLFV